ncbi:MAG: ArsB/NhaD family transporter [Dehalococcoidales bacterium]|nr:ArsB/NhaD family transporter [Dehalococcoidales bacterium]
METSQILAVIIFGIMFAIIIWEKYPRYVPALVGAVFMIGIVFFAVMQSPDAMWKVLNLGQLADWHFWVPGQSHVESFGVNWQTIIFIGGMMVMVAGMERVGFFRWICLFTARLVGCRIIPLLMSFMLISGFLSMFIDSITVLLFLSIVTIELARLLKFDPVPVIVAEIFAANVGGAATMSGDPPNIIIGTAFGYNFFDFLLNTGIIAWICMAVSLAYFYLIFRRSLKQETTPSEIMKVVPLPGSAITDRRLFGIVTAIFFFVVILIVTHAQTGLSVAIIGVIAAVITLAVDLRHVKEVFQGVNWQTLLFFIGLCICVGGLEVTGVLEMIARFIGDASGGEITLAIPLILWISAIASAIVDNIPFAATMVPVIKELAVVGGMSLPTLAWTLALGTDMGGNATPIGASANVVGTAVAQKEGYPISWGRYLKYALPPMLLVVGLSNLYLIIRYA